MKKIFLLWFFGVMALGVRAQVPYDTVTVVDPQNFTLATTIDTALVQVISRKANANRRINFQTIKNYSTPDITLSWLGIDIEDTTGTSATYRDFFVTDNEGEVWFVDNAGSARKLYDPAQFQAVTISNDTLYISDGNFAIIPGSSASAIDSISFYGDTLRIYEGGSAAPFEVEIISGGGVTGTGDADRITYWDTDTTLAFTAVTYSATELLAPTLTGAFGLPTGTTAQRPAGVAGKMRFDSDLSDLQFYNGSAWRSLAESSANAFTAGQFIIANPAGILSDTTAAGALSMMGGTSGSGTAGRVAYWDGTSSLSSNANFLWDGTELSVGTTASAYTLSVGTGGVYVTPQSAAVTGAEGAGYWDSDAPKGMWWHDGTAFRATVWGNAPSWAAETVPVSDGAKLVRYANFQWSEGDSDGLIIGGGAAGANGLNVRRIGGSGDIAAFEDHTGLDVLSIEGTGVLDFEQGISGGAGLRWGTSGQTLFGVNGQGIQASFTNSGGNKSMEFNVTATGDMACIGGNTIGGNPSQTGVFALTTFGGTTTTSTVTFRGADAGGSQTFGGDAVVRGGTSSTANANGGNLTLRGGGHSSAWFAGGGIPGDVIIEMYNDFPDSASHVAGYNTPVEVMRWNQGTRFQWVHKQRLATTTGTEVLTMEGDTIKYRIENIGAISDNTDASGDVTVTHGMGTTPTAVLVTPTGTTAWGVSVHTIGGTTFKVRFYDLTTGLAVAVSTAVTATWLAKT